MILNEYGKTEFLKSNFHPYFDIQLSSNIVEENIEQFVNFTLPIETIDEDYAITTDMKSFFNDDYTNVIFTSADEKYLYQYECYKDIYFIRIKPFQSTIRMHILPKKYNASDSILIFKDEEHINDILDHLTYEDKYEYDDSKELINLYYQENTKKTTNGMYQFDIKEKTKNFKNLQINLGYSYNDTNPTNPMEIKHYTGVLDHSDENGMLIQNNEFTEYNLSLMDANYDNVSSYTNTSKQQELINNNIEWPTDTIPYSDGDENHEKGFDNPHKIDTLYHKIIKYFNGDIYIEEGNQYFTQLWTEPRGA